MPTDFTPLDTASRLLVEAELKVATGGGGRFQPTGFPDLGPALFRGADGVNWLLVESPQSMANRLERVCWVDGDGEIDRVGRYNDDCKGIPYVLATDTDGKPLTASTLEAHRLSSPYIWNTQPFQDPDDPSKEITLADYLKRLFSLADNRLVPWNKVAAGLIRVDPGCVLHGIWFNEPSFAGGKVRLTRSLSAYIEARDPWTANFGFQKRDAVSDRTDKDVGQSAAEGYGSVIGPKQHFTSAEVKAYFQIDLGRLRSYGLLNEQVQALVAWAIYKIRRVLVASRDGVADLRTECKFEAVNVAAQTVHQDSGRKDSFDLPEIGDDLKQKFRPLKALTSAAPADKQPSGALCVRWIPKIEGKAELANEVKEGDIKRAGLEQKTRFSTEEKKKDGKKVKVTYFVVFGAWSQKDKDELRKQNAEGNARAVVEKAIAAFEKIWEAKAQGRKSEKAEFDSGDGDEDQQNGVE
jgi:CRISPR-associated protein Csb1